MTVLSPLLSLFRFVVTCQCDVTAPRRDGMLVTQAGATWSAPTDTRLTTLPILGLIGYICIVQGKNITQSNIFISVLKTVLH